MAASNAYQQVIAGRVREDEQIPFFKKNRVALPPRVTSFNATGGKKQPTIQTDHLNHPGVGKPGTTSDTLDVFLPNSDNVE
jgi:hypothetical protein